MDHTTAQDQAIDLMAHAEAAYLTTIDEDGWPTTRAMLNLRNVTTYPELAPVFNADHQDLLLYFTTNTSSEKVSQITRNNKASAYFCCPVDWRGLMLGGPISVVEDLHVKKTLWQKEWAMYYPGGVQDPDYSILCLKPRIARYYESLDSCSWTLEDRS
ncbi:MAG TPA: pyridoxamine 5'-phosphate oxidase family protein [Methanospirillum sp.]|nr:pyridoxamine 5'-phosphate oxidase family protein [Methanospirillum sp.]